MYANNFTKMLKKKLNLPVFIIFFMFNYKLVLSENEINLIFKNSSSQVCELVKKNISLGQSKNLIIDRLSERKISGSIKGKKIKFETNFLKKNNLLIRFKITFYNEESLPLIQSKLDKNCKPIIVRKITYDSSNNKLNIVTLNNNYDKIISVQETNPSYILKNKLNYDNNKIMVALVDTGINYNLEVFQKSIAVDINGEIIGYDYWENDKYPFDSDPRINPFFPRSHGSTIFSVISSEAPNAKIAIYRFPANDMCKFSDLLNEINKNSIKLINLSMGSKKLEDWQCFISTLKKYENLLVFVSAGNDGKNIDKEPIYPASLKLPNIIVVSSSDNRGRLGRGSNYGKESVDFLIPAEQLEVIDHRGVRSSTGGTSYAVPRILSMAARYLKNHPNADTKDIISALIKRAIPKGIENVKYGWIPDPTDNYGLE